MQRAARGQEVYGQAELQELTRLESTFHRSAAGPHEAGGGVLIKAAYKAGHLPSSYGRLLMLQALQATEGKC